MLLTFFKRFFRLILSQELFFIIYGFKKKYESLIYNGLLKFLNKKPIRVTFITRTLFNFFKFRRVKAIKKRIKKSI